MERESESACENTLSGARELVEAEELLQHSQSGFQSEEIVDTTTNNTPPTSEISNYIEWNLDFQEDWGLGRGEHLPTIGL